MCKLFMRGRVFILLVIFMSTEHINMLCVRVHMCMCAYVYVLCRVQVCMCVYVYVVHTCVCLCLMFMFMSYVLYHVRVCTRT